MVFRLPARLMRGSRGARSGPFPGKVPEEIVAPAFRRPVDPQGQGEGGQRGGPTRLAQQLDAHLLGRVVAFLPVAWNTAGHDVVPALVPAPGDRYDVVEGEL